MDEITSIINSLSAYDMVVLVIFVVLVVRGLWVGALKQITVFLALYIGYVVASQYHQDIFPMLKGVSENPKVVFLTSYVLLFVVTYVAVLLLGKLLDMVITLSLVGWFDRLLGGLVGALKAAIVVVLMHMILGTILAPENTMLRSCVTCGILNEACNISRSIIRDPAARDSLLHKRPAIRLDAMKQSLENSLQENKRALPKEERSEE